MKWTRLGWGGGILSLLCLVQLCLLCGAVPAHCDVAPMQNYCNKPPFPSVAVSSNLLLMLDNSASMFDLAYQDKNSYCSVSNRSCISDPDCQRDGHDGGSCNPSYCVDGSYDNGNSHLGYFDRSSIYLYDKVSGSFLPGATLPTPPCGASSCAASTNYLYVEMKAPDPPATTRTVSRFMASGNFLNWLTASKIDLQKQALTGGKFLVDKGVLQGETRGCQGESFIKFIPGTAITFAIQGPFTEPHPYPPLSYPIPISYGGATTIDIYDKPYNTSACMSAVRSWVNNDREAVISNANLCQGLPVEDPSALDTKTFFNRLMADCSFYFALKLPLGLKVDAEGDATIYKECDAFRNAGGTLPDACAKNFMHTPRSGGRQVAGFILQCDAAQDITACTGQQIAEYCYQITPPVFTDPSVTANLAGTSASVPDFLLRAGVLSLGEKSETFNARVAVGSAPSGLIQQFSGNFNFGAMIFNTDGAGSECAGRSLSCVKHCRGNSSTVCTINTDCGSAGPCEQADGGRIISYLNDPLAPVGDHGSGLIQAVDSIIAAGWSPFAEYFYNAIGYFAGRAELRLNTDDFDTNKPAPAPYSCLHNNILLVSDGMSTADSNTRMEALALLYGAPRGAVTGSDPSCPPYKGSRSLDDLAWIARNRNIKTFSTSSASTDLPVFPSQSITTHVIFTGSSNGAPGECDPATLMRATATSGGGIYATASDPSTLHNTLRNTLAQIAGVNAGGNASFLSTGDGNGAIFLQQQFSPLKSFDDGATSASWIGELGSLWYYVDPFLGDNPGAGSSIREDSNGDKMLTLADDRVVQFLGGNQVSLYNDANADGTPDAPAQSISADGVRGLWRAGVSLWQQSPVDRTIYTQTDGASLTRFTSLINSSNPDSRALQALQAANAVEAQGIISYVAGSDGSYRSRQLKIKAGTIPDVSGGSNVWKLGDIISSTPKVQYSAPLNTFHLPAPAGYSDNSYLSFIRSSNYSSRDGVVYVGANDGMLHAIQLGKLGSGGTGKVKATLDGSNLGKELWSFVPKNVLPYLTYLKEPGYRHIYYVDGAVTLLDASIGDTNSGECVKSGYWNCTKELNTWRSVLIGGMGLGGASSCDGGGDCVPPPIANPYQNANDPSSKLGYSSYFALDVTDPLTPQLLWEFSSPALGYSSTGPAIVRINSPAPPQSPVDPKQRNGKWFAVFGSGPTGPLSGGQFLGRSNQELKFFVVDLRTGALVATLASGIKGFAGSMTGGAIDVGRRSGSYQDDAIYVGYTRSAGDGTFSDGGVLRILTDENPDPTKWQVSKVLDGIGPVTGGIARLQDNGNNNLWLYFGTGRYFFNQDDMKGARSLFGVKEPCYSNGAVPLSCTTSLSPGSIVNQSTTIKKDLSGDGGWRIDLALNDASNGTERLVTTPTAVTSGGVFFTTFQPSMEPCHDDSSYLWGVQYDSGDVIPPRLRGLGMLPLSNGGGGNVKIPGDLNGRRSNAISGRAGGVRVVSNSGLKPLKKIIHIQER